ncbi:alkyl hydroperoxide reductase/ thiol specific antioxidant/ Mal allergen [Natrialba chahannaoensis JCM 10990]|uniref:thioredoxin-dependent peroxiredoxin n=1 Tax=Natrialba chahannaoensis JCM 10990 TaxID=1227492 RepID=M0B2Z1_9EURY|nr:peroxiredoxin [Natrialba chahannaoensis]ELZ04922.1 alkyl hydroperoxide reductase/ thiol specific antioxidant/ Mal allergen [Natrialba chahannaoensis JCM 10990]
MLDSGDTAPEVSAINQDGKRVTLEFSRPTVLYFYPKDESPGCTIETRQFNEALDAYDDAGIEVFGVSTDDVESHSQFCSRYDLEFDLLADPTAAVANAFGVDTTDGTADRVTFVLTDGRVEHVYRNVEPNGHAREVLMDSLDEIIENPAETDLTQESQ